MKRKTWIGLVVIGLALTSILLLSFFFITRIRESKKGGMSITLQVRLEGLNIPRDKAQSAVDNTILVLRNRIDRFGVSRPSIQQVDSLGKILIELPGVVEESDRMRIRKLLQATASLEFWSTYQAKDVDLYAADARVAEILGDASAHPLLQVLIPSDWNNSCIGFAAGVDTAQVNRYLAMAADVLPVGFKGRWTLKPSDIIREKELYELIAIKATTRDGKAPLDGDVITNARVEFNGAGRGKGAPAVSMTMNAEGANKWAQITKSEVGKDIAIVLDGLVYSYPRVCSEITGGSSQITGNFDVQEAEDLANVLNSGRLPVPVVIIQEQIIDPPRK